jgi:hypothetical protein
MVTFAEPLYSVPAALLKSAFVIDTSFTPKLAILFSACNKEEAIVQDEFVGGGVKSASFGVKEVSITKADFNNAAGTEYKGSAKVTIKPEGGGEITIVKGKTQTYGNGNDHTVTFDNVKAGEFSIWIHNGNIYTQYIFDTDGVAGTSKYEFNGKNVSTLKYSSFNKFEDVIVEPAPKVTFVTWGTFEPILTVDAAWNAEQEQWDLNYSNDDNGIIYRYPEIAGWDWNTVFKVPAGNSAKSGEFWYVYNCNELQDPGHFDFGYRKAITGDICVTVKIEAVVPACNAKLTINWVGYPYTPHVYVRQEGLGNWNHYNQDGTTSNPFVLDLCNLQFEKGQIAAGVFSIRVGVTGDFCGGEYWWDGESDVDVTIEYCGVVHECTPCACCKKCTDIECKEEKCTCTLVATWVSKIEAALAALVGSGSILDVVETYPGNNTVINLEIDGVTYEFIGGNQAHADKFCTIECVSYQINIFGNPREYRVLTP